MDSPSNEPLIEFRQVSKSFRRQPILDRIDLTVARGTTIALVGPSGAGKTTMLKLVNRLVSPTGGQVLVASQNVAEVDLVRLRRGIGYVVQEAALFPHMTAAENVDVVPRLLGWSAERRQARAEELFELVGLSYRTFAKRYPAELSGGQRQRIGLARALAADPEVVLMDEPFGALDPIARRRMQDEFLAIKQQVQKTIMLVTHDMGEAFRLADQIAVVADGRLHQTGSPAQIRQEPASTTVSEMLCAYAALS